jgi:hypothetical protein
LSAETMRDTVPRAAVDGSAMIGLPPWTAPTRE